MLNWYINLCLCITSSLCYSQQTFLIWNIGYPIPYNPSRWWNNFNNENSHHIPINIKLIWLVIIHGFHLSWMTMIIYYIHCITVCCSLFFFTTRQGKVKSWSQSTIKSGFQALGRAHTPNNRFSSFPMVTYMLPKV